jgi:Uma2 family endonuclease
MATAAKQLYTPEQYLAMERAAPCKSEYMGGEIFAMAGSSLRHSRICVNLTVQVETQVAPHGCEAYDSNARVNVGAAYLYPDLSVVCGKAEYLDDGQLDNLINPIVIFEVLSKSTEADDRGEKFARYQRITTLMSYVLISQNKPKVEVFQRLEDPSWRLTAFEGLDATVDIPGINCILALRDIYNRIEFDPVLELLDNQ